MSFPKYKEDVFVCIVSDTDGNSQARRAGYKFYTYDHYADAELYEVDTKRGFGRALHQNGASVVFYPDLPSKKDEVMVTFEGKVLEFIRNPERSNQNSLMLKLAERRFFGADEKSQRRIINELLASSDFCEQGKDKFREHMGDMLQPTGTTFIMEVTSEHFDESLGGAIASDIMTALKENWGVHTELGKLVVKFVEVKESK